MADFGPAIEVVLANEGGLAEHKDDPGGVTNWGISSKAYPSIGAERIRAMTREQAVALYHADRWEGHGFDRIVDQAVATKVFDMTVNLGHTTAIRLLQRALNYLVRRPRETEVDGVLGPATLRLVNEQEPELLVMTLRAYAALRYVELVEGPDPRFETFAKSWLQRAMG